MQLEPNTESGLEVPWLDDLRLRNPNTFLPSRLERPTLQALGYAYSENHAVRRCLRAPLLDLAK